MFYQEISVHSLDLHVSLTAAVAVTDKLFSTAESNPTATVPTEETGRDDDTADGEPCSTSAVLGNISDCTNQQFLQILVENIVKSHDFTLEVLPDISSAVVTFQSRKGTHLKIKSIFIG